jgi:methionine sulfoxide reductase heme-binding subunit
MPPRRAPAGWRLVAAAFVAVAGGCGAVIAVAGAGDAGLRLALRASAATSLALFLAAFTASSLQRLWPGGGAAWLLRNRRSLGVSFAASHTVHLALIVALVAVHADGFWAERTVASLVPGATTYLFILLMTVTSFDRPTRALGPRRWKLLHKVGSYVVWISFVTAYLGGLSHAPAYALPVALLVAAVALRAAARLRQIRRARRRATAPRDEAPPSRQAS